MLPIYEEEDSPTEHGGTSVAHAFIMRPTLHKAHIVKTNGYRRQRTSRILPCVPGTCTRTSIISCYRSKQRSLGSLQVVPVGYVLITGVHLFTRKYLRSATSSIRLISIIVKRVIPLPVLSL
jgi:hypothetical protein